MAGRLVLRASLVSLALLASAGCDNSFAPATVEIDGAWRGNVHIDENTCTPDMLDDVESWFVTRSGSQISIFFSHREYVGTLVGDRFETRRTPQTSFCGLYIRTEDCLGLDATLAGEGRADRLDATETVIQTNGAGVTCRTVRVFEMRRPVQPALSPPADRL